MFIHQFIHQYKPNLDSKYLKMTESHNLHSYNADISPVYVCELHVCCVAETDL